jgi:uncharacterized protein
MSSMSRALVLAASVAMLPGACTGAAVRGSENPRHETAVVIGAGSVGSDYYPLGGAVCRLVNLETGRHGIRCRTATSPGSVFDVTALREGRFDLAVLRSDVQHDAVTGRGPADRRPRPDRSRRPISIPAAHLRRAGRSRRDSMEPGPGPFGEERPGHWGR